MSEKSFRYNIEGLAQDMEVSLEALSPLYSEFFHEMKVNMEESKALCANKDWVKLERVIHNIKGISISLNVDDIHNLTQKLSMDLKSKEYENAFSYMNSINNLFNSSEVDIRDFFKSHGITI
jgi:HPt (histidine-containing phosphotransfer) domain-containing protein